MSAFDSAFDEAAGLIVFLVAIVLAIYLSILIAVGYYLIVLFCLWLKKQRYKRIAAATYDEVMHGIAGDYHGDGLFKALWNAGIGVNQPPNASAQPQDMGDVIFGVRR